MRLARTCFVWLALTACGKDGGSGTVCDVPDARASCPETAPRYYDEIIPILETKCNNCHDGTQGLWPLTDYQSVVDWAAAIEADILSCGMPPPDSPQLTHEEAELLLEWLACGAPRETPDAGSSVIGNACVPDTERDPSFSGAALTEVVLGTSPGCGDQICLSNHFQGRVSCPYGQTEAEIAELPADAPARCRVPDAAGSSTGEAVEVPVAPQLVERRADAVVSCSCQCDGPVPSAEYCSCPAGTECTLLVEDFAQGVGDWYCIKSGTAYDTSSAGQPACDKASDDPATHCGGDPRRNP